MGCDIHLHVEVKHRDGRWLHYNHPRLERAYALFDKMAGVRHSDEMDITPISPPKGLPADVSEMTALCYERWIGDAHSHSWLSGKEIAELDRWFREEYPWKDKRDVHGLEGRVGYLFGSGITFDPERDAGSSSYPKWLVDVRLVFWFDN